MQDLDAFRVHLSASVFTDGSFSHETEQPRSSMTVKRDRFESSATEDESRPALSEPRERSKVWILARQEHHESAASRATPGATPSWKNSDYCCERLSPLISVYNQSLVDKLGVIRKQRELTSQR